MRAVVAMGGGLEISFVLALPVRVLDGIHADMAVLALLVKALVVVGGVVLHGEMDERDRVVGGRRAMRWGRQLAISTAADGLLRAAAAREPRQALSYQPHRAGLISAQIGPRAKFGWR